MGRPTGIEREEELKKFPKAKDWIAEGLVDNEFERGDYLNLLVDGAWRGNTPYDATEMKKHQRGKRYIPEEKS